MDCLYAECTPCLTACVLAELEKLGQKYRVALRVAKVQAMRFYLTHNSKPGLARIRCASVSMTNQLTIWHALQDPRIEHLPCTHSGTYADDCLCERVQQHKCYIVATCDRDLRRRIRKVLNLLQ